MILPNMRTTVTVAVTLFVALGLAAGPAAAAGGDGLLDGASTDDSDESDGGIQIELGSETSQGGGSGSIDCDADSSGATECQKEGTLEGGPGAVEYEGYHEADPANQEGSFGDSLTVEANNESFGGSIECELSTNTSGNPCEFNYSAPGGGGAPTLPPEDPGLPSPPEDPGLPIQPPEDPGLPIEPPTDPGLPSPPEGPGLPVPPERPELPGPGLPASILA